MDLARLHGLTRLVLDAVRVVSRLVERTDRGVSERTLGWLDLVPPVGEAARAVETVRRVGTSVGHATVRAVTHVVDAVAEVPFALLEARAARRGAPTDAPATPLDSDAMGSAAWLADAAQGALSGVFGDYLERRGNRLDPGMSLRHDGRVVRPRPAELARTYAAASERIAVFVHGLSTTEWSWSYGAREQWGDSRTCYGALLERDLGYTPVYVRYNSGRHVSDNGRELARLVDELVRGWPRPVREVVLVGHSMGGLVVRSAAHYAARDDAAWLPLLGRVTSIGAPHLGSPIEKGAHLVERVLGGIGAAAAQVPSEILRARSAGIKDLRYGYTTDEEWRGRDPDAFFEDCRRAVPFVDSATYAFVAGSLTRDPEHPLGRLVGDLMVRVPSARGAHPERARRVPFHGGAVLGGLSHLALVNHPDVYAVLRRLHEDEPELLATGG
ncbi:MAG: alpha/beta fold hydrolase [Polyangiaceae bacterium]|nr:alpha/beta fold hydrolase [Polyangiaceae bacterium]